jgi:hypothetical protein
LDRWALIKGVIAGRIVLEFHGRVPFYLLIVPADVLGRFGARRYAEFGIA